MKTGSILPFVIAAVLVFCLSGTTHASYRDEELVRSRWTNAARGLSPADLPGLEQRAEEGDAEARMVLVYALSGDSPLGEDPGKAVRFARLAAEEGNPFAQAVIMYLVGRYPDAGVSPEYAFQMTLESALQGNSSGMLNAGTASLYGIGVPRDPETAFVMLEDARRLGHPDAVHRLCTLLADSREAGNGLLVNRLLASRKSAGYRCEDEESPPAEPSASPAVPRPVMEEPEAPAPLLPAGGVPADAAPVAVPLSSPVAALLKPSYRSAAATPRFLPQSPVSAAEPAPLGGEVRKDPALHDSAPASAAQPDSPVTGSGSKPAGAPVETVLSAIEVPIPAEEPVGGHDMSVLPSTTSPVAPPTPQPATTPAASRPVPVDPRPLQRLEVLEILATTRDLSGRTLTGLDLEGLDFSGAKLAGANLQGADCYRADFSGADLTGANLRRAALERATFRSAVAPNTDFSSASLFFARLEGAKLRGSRIRSAYAAGSRLVGADLTGADLSGSDFSGADFTGAELTATAAEGMIASGSRGLSAPSPVPQSPGGRSPLSVRSPDGEP